MIEQPGWCPHCRRYVSNDWWHEPECPALADKPSATRETP